MDTLPAIDCSEVDCSFDRLKSLSKRMAVLLDSNLRDKFFWQAAVGTILAEMHLALHALDPTLRYLENHVHNKKVLARLQSMQGALNEHNAEETQDPEISDNQESSPNPDHQPT